MLAKRSVTTSAMAKHILVPRASVSFSHVVGILRRVALGTRMMALRAAAQKRLRIKFSPVQSATLS